MCVMIAGDLDDGSYGGQMTVLNSGPYTVEEIAADTGMRLKLQREALDELVAIGFLSRDLSGTYTVEKFEEKCAPKSYLSTDRSRAKRERKRNESATNEQPTENGCCITPEEEEDSREKNYNSLRSSALKWGTWPKEPEILAALGLIFIDRFANCRDLTKAKKHLGPYTSCLAAFNQRGATIAQAWKACEDCWKAGGELPLFSGKIKSSLSFLPSRFQNDKPQQSQYRTVVGFDADGKEIYAP